METLAKVQKELHLQGGIRRCFEYLARSVHVTEKEVRTTMPKSVRSVELISVSPERKKQPTAAVSEEERSEMRSLLGSLQWLCQQTRVDIAVSVNKMAQRITKATVRDLLECNAIGKRVLETPDLGITLPRGVFDAKKLCTSWFWRCRVRK